MGFPIRKSPDYSLCSGSPKLFAATYVLHRLLVPRHPPCALDYLLPKTLVHEFSMLSLTEFVRLSLISLIRLSKKSGINAAILSGG